MTDRELIKAELQSLQKILEAKADMCIGNGKVKMLSFANACSGALKLLKEQEPRVLTLEEVVKHERDFVYVEKERRAYSKEVEAFCGKYRVYCTTSVALERQSFGDSEYNKTWRCWSACPTDEQRKAVKWE